MDPIILLLPLIALLTYLYFLGGTGKKKLKQRLKQVQDERKQLSSDLEAAHQRAARAEAQLQILEEQAASSHTLESALRAEALELKNKQQVLEQKLEALGIEQQKALAEVQQTLKQLHREQGRISQTLWETTSPGSAPASPASSSGRPTPLTSLAASDPDATRVLTYPDDFAEEAFAAYQSSLGTHAQAEAFALEPDWEAEVDDEPAVITERPTYRAQERDLPFDYDSWND